MRPTKLFRPPTKAAYLIARSASAPIKANDPKHIMNRKRLVTLRIPDVGAGVHILVGNAPGTERSLSHSQ
jgi:hypothetical protein